ncbi:Hypothetical predicted protein [Olea europaea subsp. europaea]|uniref:Uncharacterized protein n=1 Tax=Olea europaea subsp. europaea TaxID=158383 RepID=A0A8S0QJ79_OLEEU|nr:Hypothetical predicted protein [Olea europaea subsp. europaea]
MGYGYLILVVFMISIVLISSLVHALSEQRHLLPVQQPSAPPRPTPLSPPNGKYVVIDRYPQIISRYRNPFQFKWKNSGFYECTLQDRGQMEFDFCIPEDKRLRAHISQRSNLKTIRTDKVNELWFNVQGNLMKFGLQEYTLVTRLRYSVFPKGDDFDQVLERRRFRGFGVKKFQKAKRRQEKEITYTIHDFLIVMQVWAYEAVPEIGKRFGQRVGERMPRLLSWSAQKQPQHRTYDTFFKNVQFNASYVGSGSGGQLARQDSDDGVSSGGSAEDETFGDDNGDRRSGSDRDGDDTEDSGEGTNVNGGDMEPCPNEQDIRVYTGTAYVQDGGYIALCLDDKHHPMPAATDEQLGDLTEVLVPATVAELGHEFPAMRRCFARL